MLKTYKDDALYLPRLMASFHRHNADTLMLFLVAPREDRTFFEAFLSDRVVFVADDEIPASYGSKQEADTAGVGFWNPGIVRLAFWKLGRTENYFAIDSDMVFLRDFRASDFLLDDGRFFLATTENPSEKIDPFYYERYWDHRERAMGVISETLGTPGQRGAWAHNSQVFNTEILSALEDFIISKGLTGYKSLMERAPYEFFWYAQWALSQKAVPFIVRAEFVKMVNHQGEHLSLWGMGTRERDLARSYLGVIVNSNWSRQYGVVDFDSPPTEAYFRQGKWAEWEGKAGHPLTKS